MKKRLISLIGTLVLICLLAVTAYADAGADIGYCSSLEEMGAALRTQLKERQPTCVVGYVCESEAELPSEEDVWNQALIHTGVPDEGDYLKSCLNFGAIGDSDGFPISMIYEYEFKQSSNVGEDGRIYAVYTYANVHYRTTLEQEKLVDAKIAELLPDIRRDCKDNTVLDIFRIERAIPYMDTSDDLCHTAYGALVNDKTVCEGYAALFYRLALECGIDSRSIIGVYRSADGEQFGHAWNYVKMDDSGYYYLLDATHGIYITSHIANGDKEMYVVGIGAMEPGFMDTYPLAKTPYSGGFEYSFDSATGTLTLDVAPDIVKKDVWESSEGQYTFVWPEEIKNGTKKIICSEKLSSIGDYAFENFTQLEEIRLPSSLSHIGNYAFSYCKSLIKIDLPDSVEKIGDYAFGNCESLCEVTFTKNNSIKELGEGAFRGCSSLTAFDLELIHITHIPKEFISWSKLKEICIPDSVVEIGESSFACTRLTEVVIPDNVAFIGAGAFSLTPLKKIVISPNSKLLAIGDGAFQSTQLEDIYIPESVRDIGQYAFYESNLRNVSLPEGISIIKEGCFKNCQSLRRVYVPDSVKVIDTQAFYKCPIIGLYIPEGVETIESGSITNASIIVAEKNKFYCTDSGILFNRDKTILMCCPPDNSASEYSIPDTVKRIDDYAFYSSDFTSVEIPNGVTYIGEGAFKNSSRLKSIVIPDSVETIGVGAFSGCYSLEKAALGENIRILDYELFAGDENLKEVSIGPRVDMIMPSVFLGCRNLQTVNYGDTLDRWNTIEIYSENEPLFEAEIICGQENAAYINISLDAMGGTVEKDILPVSDMSGSVYEGLPTPTREGYQFFGWFTQASGGVQIKENDPVLKFYDHSLYAHWEDTVLATGEVNDTISWTAHSTGELAIYGSGEKLPCNDSNAPVIYLWNSKFDKSNIKSISIDGAITTIGTNALIGFLNATELVISQGVKEIEPYAIRMCPVLKSISLPDGLEIISSNAFAAEPAGNITWEGLPSLESITIPSSVKFIGKEAFSLSGLKEVIVELDDPNSEFGYGVFKDCTSLEKATISVATKGMFHGCTSLTTVSFTKNAHYIQDYAFTNCTALETVVLPDSIYSIGRYAFSSCTSLKTMVIPDSVFQLDSFAFAYDSQLKSVRFSENIKMISTSAFFGCTALEEITLPPYCMKADKFAFKGCSSLKTITIPETLNSVEEMAFNSTALETVIWGGKMEDWKNVSIKQSNNPLLKAHVICVENDVPLKITVGFDSMGGTEIDDTVEVIKGKPYGELPTPVKEGSFFNGWFTDPFGGKKVSADTKVFTSEAHTLYAHWNNIIDEGKCGDSLYYVISENGTMHIYGTGDMYEFITPPWDTYKARILTLNIDESVTSISDGAFNNFNIDEVTIPNSVSHIGKRAFAECRTLRKIIFPEDISEIPAYMLFECIYLDNITIPDSVVQIGEGAFKYCDSLTALYFPDNVKKIGASALSYCQSLVNVRLPNGLTEISDYMFEECRLLPEITIPNTVTHIGNGAFKVCEKFTEITIPDSVISIGKDALSDTISLTKVHLPKNITEIPEGLFAGCKKLEGDIIPSGVTKINKFAFSFCVLGKLNIPETVSQIEEKAFMSCTAEEINIRGSNVALAKYAFLWSHCNVMLPDTAHISTDCFNDFDGNITIAYDSGKISDYCFSYAKINQLEICEGITEIGQKAFAQCDKISSVHLPDTMQTLGDCAFENSSVSAINLVDGITRIGDNCFTSSKLTRLVIPASVSYLGNSAFASGSELTEIVFLGREDTCAIGEDAFKDVTAKVYYPDEHGSDAPIWTEAVQQDYGGALTWMEWYTLGDTPNCQHEFSSNEVVLEDSCMGYTLNTCACGYSYRSDFRYDLHSSGTDTVVPPTCTEEGYTEHICNRCGSVYKDSKVPALGHDNVSVVTEPTCTEAGYTTHTCTRCGNVCTDAKTSALGHDYASIITEPTCAEAGYTTHTCTRCGSSYIDSEIAALGHSFGAWQIIDEPDCTESGTEKHVCSVCNFSEFRPVEALGHSFETQITEPTCTEDGYTTHTCTRCKYYYIDSEVPAQGHFYGEWQITTAASCTEAGEQLCRCTKCSASKTEVIPALGHDYAAVPTEPTCTEGGYTTHTCTRCDDTYVDSETNALGHDYISEVTAPTCIEGGYSTHTCTRCEHSYVDSETAALGHSFGEWKLLKNSTLKHEGANIRFCEVCDASETEVLPVTTAISIEITALPGRLWYISGTPLNLDGMVVTAHCANDTTEIIDDYSVSGYNDSMLGEQLITVTYAGLSDSFTVTVVGAMLGDLDGDGVVTDEDALYLLMHIFFPEKYPLAYSCDFDGDGSVTDGDALYLLMHVYFPDAYPLL